MDDNNGCGHSALVLQWNLSDAEKRLEDTPKISTNLPLKKRHPFNQDT